MKWLENDELFKAECAEGHQWERFVAAFLRLQGLDVALTPQKIREHVSQRKEYENLVDVRCEGVPIEVKSRRLRFTRPQDIPFATLLVDTVSGWEDKDPKPRVYISVSRITGAILWVSSKTRDQWAVNERYDHVRKIHDRFMEAPRRLWRPVDELVEHMKKVKKD